MVVRVCDGMFMTKLRTAIISNQRTRNYFGTATWTFCAEISRLIRLLCFHNVLQHIAAHAEYQDTLSLVTRLTFNLELTYPG
jgi:hypothetical protein